MKIFNKEMDWTTIIFWLGIITLFLWLLAKTLGFIHTPLIIELIPLISGFAIVITAIKNMGKFIHRVENGLSDIRDLKERVGKIEVDVHSLDKRVAIIESRI